GVFGKIQPLSFDELKAAADRINRSVLIRTREDGEVVYDRNRITIADTMVVNDISQARRNY
ncbi:MAG: ribonucleoside-triphosphate reductase activating protein, partial [Methanomicrobium sp.]|nr:ribonucleoside-triphosphate reductase activating protein [Methanomicrobium sp.]